MSYEEEFPQETEEKKGVSRFTFQNAFSSLQRDALVYLTRYLNDTYL